jgi:hypothetical protein
VQHSLADLSLAAPRPPEFRFAPRPHDPRRKLGQLNLLSANGNASPQQQQLVRASKLGGLFNVIGAENRAGADRRDESRLRSRCSSNST